MIASEPEKYFEKPDLFMHLINLLADATTTLEMALKEIDKLLKLLKK
jgi:hypothetical protein